MQTTYNVSSDLCVKFTFLVVVNSHFLAPLQVKHLSGFGSFEVGGGGWGRGGQYQCIPLTDSKLCQKLPVSYAGALQNAFLNVLSQMELRQVCYDVKVKSQKSLVVVRKL